MTSYFAVLEIITFDTKQKGCVMEFHLGADDDLVNGIIRDAQRGLGSTITKVVSGEIQAENTFYFQASQPIPLHKLLHMFRTREYKLNSVIPVGVENGEKYIFSMPAAAMESCNVM